jgi:hypothetical protein
MGKWLSEALHDWWLRVFQVPVHQNSEGSTSVLDKFSVLNIIYIAHLLENYFSVSSWHAINFGFYPIFRNIYYIFLDFYIGQFYILPFFQKFWNKIPLPLNCSTKCPCVLYFFIFFFSTSITMLYLFFSFFISITILY